MEQPVSVKRWMDISSDEAKSLSEYNFILKCIRLGVYSVNSFGYAFTLDGKHPIHIIVNGEVVGIRIADLAKN